MTAKALLQDLERNGVKIVAHGDKLRVSPRGVIGPDVRALLLEHKAEILALLQQSVMAPTEMVPTLVAEEALYRLWWKTLPDKDLARRCDGHLAYWQTERGLSADTLTWLRSRVSDLIPLRCEGDVDAIQAKARLQPCRLSPPDQ